MQEIIDYIKNNIDKTEIKIKWIAKINKILKELFNEFWESVCKNELISLINDDQTRKT